MSKILQTITGMTLGNAVKISIVLAVLLVSFAIFYHYVIFLPQKEEAKLEQQRQEQLTKELKEREEQEALDACIANAEKKYNDQWNKECKALGRLTSSCIDIHELSFSEYLDKYDLNPETYNQQRELPVTGEAEDFIVGLFDYFERRNDECSCRLPISTADRFGERLDEAKAECFKRFSL